MNIKIKPREYQLNAVKEMLLYKKALLQAPTGSGKTNIAIYLTTSLNKKTIIVVPKTDLIKQTYERFLSVTDIDPKNIVKYNGRSKKIGPITLITWQSLAAALKDGNKWKLFKDYFDVVICDEAHRSGANELLYTIGVSKLNCKYQYGLSATPFRANGETRQLLSFFDNNKIIIDIDIMYKTGSLIKPYIDFVFTGLHFNTDKLMKEWQKKYFGPEQQLGILKKAMGINYKRNKMIIDHINKTRRSCNIVLSYTTEQTDILHSMDDNKNKIKIYGKMNKKDQEIIIDQINNMNEITIYATQSFLGEGTDIPKLQNLYITTPFAGGVKAIQFAGRVLRPYKNKSIVKIYDYWDCIYYNPMNKKNVDINSWVKKRAQEYLKLKPNFLKKYILEY